MFKIFILISFFIINLCANVIGPSWYKPNSNVHIIYSYGNTLNEAKLNAKIKLENRLLSNISIDDFTLENKEFFENRYFIKVKYINETIYNQVKMELLKQAFKIDNLTNKYLIKTNFFSKLNEEFGYYPNIEIYNNHLDFNNKKYLIKNSEFNEFFAIFYDENLSIDMKDIVNDNEKFFMKIENLNKNQYTTLARFIDGKFYIIYENINIQNSVIVPNFKESDGFSIDLQNKNYLEFLNIVISCEDKKDFSNYNSLYQNKEEALGFGDFIKEINNCKIASKILKVQK